MIRRLRDFLDALEERFARFCLNQHIAARDELFSPTTGGRQCSCYCLCIARVGREGKRCAACIKAGWIPAPRSEK
ncbi:MAG: hypothetical protein QOJ81_1324 [Chloroflexota bacterium]|nr:hypothetical protein [Chloroflexota bacterium]